jgi:hypothetical protein
MNDAAFQLPAMARAFLNAVLLQVGEQAEARYLCLQLVSQAATCMFAIVCMILCC